MGAVGQEMPKNKFQSTWNTESVKPISELYADDNKSKYSSNPKDIFKSAKTFYGKLYIEEKTSKAATTKFFSKIPHRNKIPKEQLNLCDAKIYLDEIIKSINSQRNTKSLGNDTLTTEFYKHCSSDLAPVDV